jgi:hypothetical protein
MGVPGKPCCFEYSQQYSILALGFNNGQVHIFSDADLHVIIEHESGKSAVKCILFMQTYLIVLNKQNQIFVWDLSHSKISLLTKGQINKNYVAKYPLVRLIEWKEAICSLQVLNGLKYVWIGDSTGTISGVNFNHGEEFKLYQIQSEYGKVVDMIFHARIANHLLVAYENGTIVYLDVYSKTELSNCKVNGNITCLSWASSKKYFIVGTDNGDVIFYSLRSMTPVFNSNNDISNNEGSQPIFKIYNHGDKINVIGGNTLASGMRGLTTIEYEEVDESIVMKKKQIILAEKIVTDFTILNDRILVISDQLELYDRDMRAITLPLDLRFSNLTISSFIWKKAPSDDFFVDLRSCNPLIEDTLPYGFKMPRPELNLENIPGHRLFIVLHDETSLLFFDSKREKLVESDEFVVALDDPLVYHLKFEKQVKYWHVSVVTKMIYVLFKDESITVFRFSFANCKRRMDKTGLLEWHEGESIPGFQKYYSISAVPFTRVFQDDNVIVKTSNGLYLLQISKAKLFEFAFPIKDTVSTCLITHNSNVFLSSGSFIYHAKLNFEEQNIQKVHERHLDTRQAKSFFASLYSGDTYEKAPEEWENEILSKSNVIESEVEQSYETYYLIVCTTEAVKVYNNSFNEKSLFKFEVKQPYEAYRIDRRSRIKIKV